MGHDTSSTTNSENVEPLHGESAQAASSNSNTALNSKESETETETDGLIQSKFEDVKFELEAGSVTEQDDKHDEVALYLCPRFCMRICTIVVLSAMVMSSSVLSKASFLGKPACPYNSNTVVLVQEMIKAFLSLMFLFVDGYNPFPSSFHRSFCAHNFSEIRVSEDVDHLEVKRDKTIRRFWCSSGREFSKYAIPGLLYMLGNNVKFFALAYLSPAEFGLIWNVKIVATVIFMMCLLGRHFSRLQRVSILLLIVSITFTEFPMGSSSSSESGTKTSNSNISSGYRANATIKGSFQENAAHMKLFGALITVFGATVNGGANVIIEYTYKSEAGTMFWMQNYRLYIFGIFYNGVVLLLEIWYNASKFREGIFYGWNFWTILVALSGSTDGLLVGFLMKFADNVAVIHADVLGTILNIIVSAKIFGLQITPLFSVVASAIMLSIYLFHSDEMSCFFSKSNEEEVNTSEDRPIYETVEVSDQVKLG